MFHNSSTRRREEDGNDNSRRYYESLEPVNLTSDETLSILGKESIDEEIYTVRYRFASDCYRLLWRETDCKMLFSDYKELEKEIVGRKDEEVRKLKLEEDPSKVTERAIERIRRKSNESQARLRKKLEKLNLRENVKR